MRIEPTTNRDPKIKLVNWMKDCMLKYRWTSDEWARRAGVSSINIARFIADHNSFVLSSRVLDKLAGVCDVPIPILDFTKFKIADRKLPVIKVDKMGKVQTLIKKSTQKVTTLMPVDKNAFAVQIDTDRMSLSGILPEDIIVCEPTRVTEAKHNCIIVYHTPHHGVEAGRWFPPFLMPQTSNPEHEPIKTKDVGILGVAVQQIRTLRIDPEQ
jgi:hypothetical protein